MDWYFGFGCFLGGAIVAMGYWAVQFAKEDSKADWLEKEDVFKAKLLNYHRDNLTALNVRNELTKELIKAVRELKQ